jgi:hypothetical protein
MPHDPALVQDTRAWLTRAYRDLQAAEHDMKATPESPSLSLSSITWTSHSLSVWSAQIARPAALSLRELR